MAALRGISRRLHRCLSQTNHDQSPYQLLFYRGIASKILVKGLNFATTEETLAEAFSHFGQVLEANIVMDKVRKRSKGFGYVTFGKEEEANKAITDMNGKVLRGHVIFVDKARPSRHVNVSMPKEQSSPKRAVDG
ncbi:putative RNA-binding family protein [Quillaja saponaria]|uniref:RNA-binding family protein n=1 Tax=Quillaja saponaria TaxID=32244 RepID=A0AAD7KY38_QUISA|nr:putative RNA-binding family protein [Quillaja saponaria]